jgi:hypothetical protein
MTYATAITQMATVLEAVSGVSIVHQDPPESLVEFPCFVLRWNSGELEWYTNNLMQEEATLWAILYLNSFRDAIDGVRDLSGNVFNILRWRWEGPTGLTYADNIYLGIRFEVDILLMGNIA